jgi:hypothetical protein
MESGTAQREFLGEVGGADSVLLGYDASPALRLEKNAGNH